MAITADTREDIIQLVVTALNAAPGTSLLTELVAIVDGGGTLADVAAAIAAGDDFQGLYPSFLTAEEFAASWLGALVPEADADALAEGTATVVGLVNGGASAADLLLEAQTFLASVDEADAAFGTSAANFNNKVEVATYHTVSQQQDADNLAALQSILSGVTSDDDTVTEANDNVDSGGGTVSSGSTFTLTDNIDTISGTSSNDVVIGDNVTASAADTLELGEGSDTVRLFQTATLPSLNSVENAEFFNISNQDIDTSNSTSLENVLVKNSTLTADIEIILDNDEQLTLDTVVGNHEIEVDSDDVVIILNGVSDSAGDVDLDVDGTDDLYLMATGSSSDVDLVDATNDLESLTITGDAHLDVQNAAITSLETIDASGTTGGVDMTIDAASDVTYTGGSGKDALDVNAGTLDDDDSFDGGDGTDEFEISQTGDDSVSGDLNITNFETLRLNTDITSNVTLDFDNVTGLTSLNVGNDFGGAGSSHTHTLRDITTELTSINFIGFGSLTEDTDLGFDGVTMDYDSSSAVDAVTVSVTNFGTSGGDYTIQSVNLPNVTDIAINAADADSVTITAAVDASDAEKIDVTSSSDVDFAAGITGSTDLETFDASGSSGDIDLGTGITLIADEANITTGSGDDTVVIAAGANGATIETGDGSDTVDVSNDTDNVVTLGDGSDTLIVDSAADSEIEVTDFKTGTGGDIIDLAANEATGTNVVATTYAETAINGAAVTATAGFHVVTDGSGGGNDAADLTTANVAAFLADVDGAGNDFGNDAGNDGIIYIAVTDGSDTGIFKADDAGGNTDGVIDAAELTLLVTLTGVDDPTALSVANFADFLA